MEKMNNLEKHADVLLAGGNMVLMIVNKLEIIVRVEHFSLHHTIGFHTRLKCEVGDRRR